MKQKTQFTVFIAIGILMLGISPFTYSDPHAIREYVVNKITGTPPVMNGVYSETEWAGSEWTTGFYGLNNQSSNGSNQGNLIGLNYRWRALWDDNYLYFLYEAEMYDLPINGIAGNQIINPVENDDDTHSYSIGIGTNLEIFFEPNWQAGDGFNSDPPAFTNAGGNGVNDGYHVVWFPLDADPGYTENNEGVRNASHPTGPPFFSTSGAYNTTYLGGDWNPTFDPAEAAAQGALPMIAGALLHKTGAGYFSGEVYARPILEIAIPFSQLNPAWGIAERGNEGETNLTLVKDANGKYVKSGNEWLVNVCGYTDNYTAARGLTLVTWNNVIGGPFASYPRGKLIFTGETAVQEWMVMD
ncbi:MAG: hypothetical protein C4527_26700 [Candidatus Omnitrophota bacterium]|jgi:hypothetical protein|nr:MAG: hypothetical protein C4527_26700 [Candidatus Omnitrophota bacterium]